MKVKKEIVIGVAVIVAALIGFNIFIIYQRSKARRELASHILSLGNSNPTQTVETLTRSIAVYEKRIEQHISDAAQTGVYWKILATRLQDRGLHNEALDALERALHYTPSDAVLHYLTGISAAITAKNTHDFEGTLNAERNRLLFLAEEAFLRAIEIDGNSLKSRYSLGVLYVFDLERPADAVPHLLKALEISRSDVDTMFVLARAYYELSSFREAVEVYDRIISVTKDDAVRLEAQNNRQLAMGQLYG